MSSSSDSSPSPTVVLIHGAFADASGFAGLIRELQAADVPALAPAVPLRGLTSDADAIAAFVGAIEGPVVMLGHSYGGAVITQASAGLDNVIGLIYLAGFALEVGESAASVQEAFPPPLLATSGQATPFDAPGAAGGPDLFIDAKSFRETFCADLSADVAAVMAASQRPLAAAAIGEPCTAAGWKTKPTSYLVSAQDRAISPETEHFMGERTGGRVATIDASHVAFMSRPVDVGAFVLAAIR